MKPGGVDPVFRRKRHRFRHGFHSGAEHEVAGQFDDIGAARILAEIEDGLPEGLQEGANAVLGFARTGDADPEFPRGRRFGPAEDRSRDVGNAETPVVGSHAPGGCRRDRAHRDVNAAGPERPRKLVAGKRDFLERPVVGEHGDHHAARERRTRRAGRKLCTLRRQWHRFRGVAVEDPQGESRSKQIGRHGPAHVSQAYKPDCFAHPFLRTP